MRLQQQAPAETLIMVPMNVVAYATSKTGRLADQTAARISVALTRLKIQASRSVEVAILTTKSQWRPELRTGNAASAGLLASLRFEIIPPHPLREPPQG